MGEYKFEEIKRNIFEWIQDEKIQAMIKKNEFEVSKNNDDILLLDLDFDYCLAQITVNNPFFAPYQFVSFEAMTLDSEKAQKTGKPELVYFFYDSSEMTKKVVMNELEIGLQYCINYIPNQIREVYLNKRGTLAIELENLRCIMHPDDIKKVNRENVKGEFVCKEMEAQYLIVTKDMLSLRILPKNFIVKI